MLTNQKRVGCRVRYVQLWEKLLRLRFVLVFLLRAFDRRREDQTERLLPTLRADQLKRYFVTHDRRPHDAVLIPKRKD